MHFYSCKILVFFPSRGEVKIVRSCDKNISVPEEDKPEPQAKYTLWLVFEYTLNPNTVNTLKSCLNPVGQNSSSRCRNICTYPHRGN